MLFLLRKQIATSETRGLTYLLTAALKALVYERILMFKGSIVLTVARQRFLFLLFKSTANPFCMPFLIRSEFLLVGTLVRSSEDESGIAKHAAQLEAGK